MEEIINLLRFKIYNECNVLVIDLSQVIEEIKSFINEKIYGYYDENEFDKMIFGSVELYKEIDKFKWQYHNKEIISETNDIEIRLNEINDLFKGKDEFYDNHGLLNFPKTLYGNAFMCLMLVISDILESSKLWDETDIFEIFKLHNNGEFNYIE